MRFNEMIFSSSNFSDESKRRSIVSFLGIVLVAVILSGCTTTAESQLKESPCVDCASKKPFYRNGEWLHD
jgi:uncharacterized lipoprotein YajG